MRRLGTAALVLAVGLGLSACPARPPEGTPGSPLGTPILAAPSFRDAAVEQGVSWKHNPCRSGRKLFPETMGGGGGFFDYNQDGRLDLLLVNGAPLLGYRGPVPRHALYQNKGDRFVDVTMQAGLAVESYGMGAAVGDFDNDGWPDVFLTGLEGGRLYHNRSGRFVDVTVSSGVRGTGWSVGSAWLDYDHDGLLDLFVADYVRWSPKTDIACGSEQQRQYCPPFHYEGAPPRLYRNLGGGRFKDVSARTGIRGHSGKTLSCTPCDADADGWTDLYLANDTEPDLLLMNGRDGTFREKGAPAGISVNTDGRATGSMGVDWATPHRDGRQSFAVGNFVGQGLSLFEAVAPPGPEPLFDNMKYEAALGEATLPMSTFGLIFTDVDLDGRQDLMVLNGHLDESLAVGERKEPYRQLPQLFQNQGNGTYLELAAQAGLTEALVGRGLAVGDYDNDGRPDFLAFENGGRVRLWHNETQTKGRWLGVELIGTKSPRDGAGALVTVGGDGWSLTRIASTTRSYLAANDPRVHFGLGASPAAFLEVRWPSGHVDRIPSPPDQQYLLVREGQGLTTRSPAAR